MNDRGPSTAAIVRVVCTAAALGLVLYALYLVRAILVLVVVSIFLAVGLDPLVRALGRFGLSRGKAVLVVFIGALLFVSGFVASVTPPLVRQTQRLARQIPDYAGALSERSETFRRLDRQYELTDRLRSGVGDLPTIAARSAESALGVARSVGRIVFSVLTVTILTIYFLLDLPALIDGAKRLVPRSRRRRYEELSEHVFSWISGYLIGQLTVSLVAGVTSFVALSLLGVPFAVALAMWVALSALIPMVGATLGAIPAVVVAFFSSVGTGIAAVVFFLLYQQAENYLIAPRVMRRHVNISPAAVILAALIGATLLGFVGALLAIPMAASIKVLAQEVWIPRQEAA